MNMYHFGMLKPFAILVGDILWICQRNPALNSFRHICVSKLANISSDNGLSPGRRQAIIWTNARILLIGPLGTNFSEIWIEIWIFSFRKMHLKMSSAKWRPFCLGLNVLKTHVIALVFCGWMGRPGSNISLYYMRVCFPNMLTCSHI